VLYEFEGKRPQTESSSFIHPDAVLIGAVIIGKKCFIGPGAVLRGDYGSIIVGDGSNVQDNCILHSQPDKALVIDENVDIGHGSIIHGPITINSNAVIGMGSILCDGCVVGTGSFLGAGCLLTPNTVIPPNKLVVGNPARIIRDVSEQHRGFSRKAAEVYQDLCERYHRTFRII
jgi:Carbonic anhydrases/acetyltransferases, isoleucine patch superfamily